MPTEKNRWVSLRAENITLSEYYSDPRFKRRKNVEQRDKSNATRHVLISKHFFYFGKKAISTSTIPRKYLDHSLEKKGPRYRCDFDPRFIKEFATWLERKYCIGIHGDPCGSFEHITKILFKCQSGRARKNKTSSKQTNGKPDGFPCR